MNTAGLTLNSDVEYKNSNMPLLLLIQD